MDLIEIDGPWKSGCALDYHVSKSTYLGKDSYGHDRFENDRSELGEFVYDIKYNPDYIITMDSIDSVFSRFVNLTDHKIKKILEDKNIDYIIGAPASNKERDQQPVELIASFIEHMTKIKYLPEILYKTTDTFSKNMSKEEKKNIFNQITINEENYSKVNFKDKNILIVDDLYESGTTLAACTNKLNEIGDIKNIYVLTMTRTKKR